MENPEEIEAMFIKGINKSLGINKFAEELYKAYPNIPSDKLLSVTRSFLENLEILEKIYKAPNTGYTIEEIDKHIPHAD